MGDPTPSLPEGPADGVTCPHEYAHPFFVYDFMPQKIMFKSDRGDDSMALDVLQVRGWGHLTGHGDAGLRINHSAAAAIQDNFGKWVAKTLTEALTAPADGVTQTGWPVPDGWKLVPIEPTTDMVGKGGGLCDFCFTKGIHETKEDYDREVIGIYHNMLIAAPLPPPPGQ